METATAPPSDFSTVASRDAGSRVTIATGRRAPSAAARAALPTATRRKLEALESDAVSARAQALAVAERVRELRDEIRRTADREAALRDATMPRGRLQRDPSRGPHAFTEADLPPADNPDAVASLLVVLREDLGRLEAERATVDAAAAVTGTVAQKAREYLGL